MLLLPSSCCGGWAPQASREGEDQGGQEATTHEAHAQEEAALQETEGAVQAVGSGQNEGSLEGCCKDTQCREFPSSASGIVNEQQLVSEGHAADRRAVERITVRGYTVSKLWIALHRKCHCKATHLKQSVEKAAMLASSQLLSQGKQEYTPRHSHVQGLHVPRHRNRDWLAGSSHCFR